MGPAAGDPAISRRRRKGKARSTTAVDPAASRRMTANEMYLDMPELMENIKELEALCADYAIEKIRAHMQHMPLEFFPVSPSNDLVGDSA